MKSGSSEQLQAFTQQFLEITDTLEQSTPLASNTLVRKYRTKLLSRVALRLMPPNIFRSKLTCNVDSHLNVVDDLICNSTVRSLDGDIKNEAVNGNVDDGDDDIDVPEEIDTILESLFKSLQDKVFVCMSRANIDYTTYRTQWYDGQQPKALLAFQNAFRRISPLRY